MQCPRNVKSLNVVEERQSEDNLGVEHIYASESDFGTLVSNNDVNGYGVLDSAATKTVCGQLWFDNFKRYLLSIGKQVSLNSSNVWYKFGNDSQKKALFAAVMPVHIFGKDINLMVDVISSNCPLLMT